MESVLRLTLKSRRFTRVPPARSHVMSAIRSSGNRSTELRLRLALVRAGIPGWKLHVTGLPGRPDFFFPRRNLAVFVDGCFWHGCPKCGHLPRTNHLFWKTKISRTKMRDMAAKSAL